MNESDKKDIESEVKACSNYLMNKFNIDSCFIVITCSDKDESYAYYGKAGNTYATMNILKKVVDDDDDFNCFK